MTSITTVAEKSGISAYTLRYYEKEGLFHVPRNEANVREYDEKALRRIYYILHYRRAGVPLAKIKEIMNTPNDDAFHLQILEEIKEKLEREIKELHDTLDFLDYKIQFHSGEKTQNNHLEKWINM
jgi:DNA-binding transcriptional MerR regulator